MTSAVRQGTIVDIFPASQAALVQVDGADSAAEIALARHIPPELLAEGDQVGVLLFDALNPQHGLVVAVYGGAAAVSPFGLAGAFLGLPGLIGFWPLLGGGGVAQLQDQGGRSLTLTNAGGTPNAVVNDLVSVLLFNGSTQYLARAHEALLNPTGSLTVGGWFLTDSAGDGTNPKGLIGKWVATGNQRAYRLTFGEAGASWRFQVSANGSTNVLVTHPSAIVTGAWHFLVGRFVASAEVALFVNGLKTANTSGVPGSTFNATGADFEIGRTNAAGASLVASRAALCFLCNFPVSDGILQRVFNQTRLAFGV
jgi:hypothetical protein